MATVICTLNRPEVLHHTVLSIKRQSLPAQQIIIASPAIEHVLPETQAIPGVVFVQTPIGLATQRNRGLQNVAAGIDLIAFLDDDIELSRSYLEEMARLFEQHPEVIVASGRMLRDGGRGARVEREDARRMCEAYDSERDARQRISYMRVDSGYGCNMVVRNRALADCRFDERLPLYAWLEDRDFSHRCTKGKLPPVELKNAVAVHLGWRTGRISGVRLGFSTVVNPLYLRRKAGTFSVRYIVVHYWLRCLVGNILGILTRDKEYDRWGLLKGNLLGYWHLVSGHCDPEHILQI
jgi:GT2 family glycosyltransferase